MILQCIADTHGQSIKLNKRADFIIILGDIGGNLFWDMKDFIASNLQFTDRVYGILGNHDDTTDVRSYPWIRWMNYGERAEIGGFDSIFLPYSDEPKSLRQESYADLVFSHTPVKGLLDDPLDEFHRGSAEYLRYLQRTKPKLWIHGHTHEAGSLTHNGTIVKCVYLEESIRILRKNDTPAASKGND